MASSKKKYFPGKPANRDGFKGPVSWLGGRELIASLKGMLIYSLYGENIDPRPWMKANVFPAVADKKASIDDFESQISKSWSEATVAQWEWKKENFAEWKKILDKHPEIANGDSGSFWFDYIADSGDGQTGVFGVGCLCLSDLWIENAGLGSLVKFRPKDFADGAPSEELLPRGSFLFVGGDTAYHVADYEAIHERFQLPFRWAFAEVRKYMVRHFGPTPSLPTYFASSEGLRKAWEKKAWEKDESGELTFDPEWDGTLSAITANERFVYWDVEPTRPLFGLPANHDYYDDLDGFNRQFRRPPYKDVVENGRSKDNKDSVPLKIPTFRREQEASYTAFRLPFGWSMFGIDSENEKLDFRQRAFFKQVFADWQPRKVIIATPEPTTVFGRKCDEKDKTAIYAKAITGSMGLKQPFLEGGELKLEKGNTVPSDKYCRLDLSGDVHHYARYWGPDQSSSQPAGYASVVAGGGGAFFDSTSTLVGKNGIRRGEIPPRAVFPSADEADKSIAKKITNLWNIQKGGYVQIVGAMIATIIAAGYYFLDPVGQLPGPNAHPSIIRATDVYTIVSTLLCLGLFIAAGAVLNSVNRQLRDGRYDPDLARNVVKIKKLRLPFACFLAGAAIYMIFLFRPNVFGPGTISKELNNLFRDILLLLDFTMAGVVFWISNQYLSWITEHFKLVRQIGKKPESWLNLLFDRVKPLDPAVVTSADTPSIFRRAFAYLSKQSVDTVPVFTINILGVLIVATTFYIFRDRSLSQVAADICFALVTIGGLVGIVYFAVSTGGHYHKGINKYLGFGTLGVVHAVLQIFTPIVLLAYGDCRLLIVIFVLTVFMNGLSGTGQFLKFVFRGNESAESSWRKAVWRIALWRLAEQVMKTRNAALMLVVWLIYGAVVLASPALWKLIFASTQTLDELLNVNTESMDVYGSSISAVLLLLVAYYIGYRFSCIWFSWYLCVSALFNGHNNEAGGAARIEGFKHILRIKVEPEKLTVYVLGFTEEKTELDELDVRLVDKFEIEAITPSNA